MPDKLRIVFMGTPGFAVESLKALIDSGQNVIAVITAPDKPAGRGKQMQSSPVKNFAIQSGVKTILQPSNLKSPEFIEELKSLRADLQLVVAFRMLPEVVWTMPRKGTVNLHASLLPDYRGAAPINWAIINGEKETGVTTFFIEKEIDTGKIIYREKVPIGPDKTAGELHDELMIAGANLLVKTVEAITNETCPAVPQEEYRKDSRLHPAPKIFKENCQIKWENKASKIHDFIRGLSPYPASWTEMTDGNTITSMKIFKSGIELADHDHETGTMLTDNNQYMKVAVKDGYIHILRLQVAGKKQLDIKEFLRGFKKADRYKIR
ncbi:Methionyl-tRNA formyltransferase [subsurface metagenome]